MGKFDDTFKRLLDPDVIKDNIEQGRINWLKEEKENKNNFSYWAPKLGSLIGPYVVFALPDWFLDAYTSGDINDKQKITDYFAENITPIIQGMFPEGECFMKNGCFSNKFSFDQNCHIVGLSNENIVEHMLNIEYDALMYETNGDLEVVFRPYISAPENCPTMYGGMPFRVELRAFYDFDNKKYLYDEFYWNWDYCHSKLDEVDNVVYEKEYERVYKEFEQQRESIKKYLEENLDKIELTGQWSVDVMVGPDGKYHVIDMATADRSAYWNRHKFEN